jgi:mRNA-degrading endonuclease toxin of MazEF toxin-antitoxin module
MTSDAISLIQNGHVVYVNWQNDDPNEPNKYKPRPVIILDKFSETYCKAVGITDIENIGDIVKAKGTRVNADSTEGRSMQLRKDSFVNFRDSKTIPTSSFISKWGKCPNALFEEVSKACL